MVLEVSGMGDHTVEMCIVIGQEMDALYSKGKVPDFYQQRHQNLGCVGSVLEAKVSTLYQKSNINCVQNLYFLETSMYLSKRQCSFSSKNHIMHT